MDVLDRYGLKEPTTYSPASEHRPPAIDASAEDDLLSRIAELVGEAREENPEVDGTTNRRETLVQKCQSHGNRVTRKYARGAAAFLGLKTLVWQFSFCRGDAVWRVRGGFLKH